MRQIHDHKVNIANEEISITVCDQPGAGGANHIYQVDIPNKPPLIISFQNGPIKESGVNGITQEVLIAICIDRLRSFQSGKFACRENALALTKIEEAQHWLHSRTLSRIARDVEGTHTV